jgi:hypothetical protein
MKFNNQRHLDDFLNKIDKYLTDDQNKGTITYNPKHVSQWNGDKLAEDNESFLSALSGEANVYMLYTAPKNSSTYKLRYIGKTTQKLARQRLRNHLFKKSESTGAKLGQVEAHVRSGGKVKVSWVRIDPQSLRNWAEEELISLHPEANWNRENA